MIAYMCFCNYLKECVYSAKFSYNVINCDTVVQNTRNKFHYLIYVARYKEGKKKNAEGDVW